MTDDKEIRSLLRGTKIVEWCKELANIAFCNCGQVEVSVMHISFCPY